MTLLKEILHYSLELVSVLLKRNSYPTQCEGELKLHPKSCIFAVLPKAILSYILKEVNACSQFSEANPSIFSTRQWIMPSLRVM